MLKKNKEKVVKENKLKEKKVRKPIKKIISKKDKDSYSFKEVVITMIISMIIGFLTCIAILILFTGNLEYIFSKELNKFFNSYKTVIENYNGDIDKSNLIDSAIEGMISSVDDVYTTYGDSEYTENFNETVTGEYEGIGCTVTKQNDNIEVVEIFDNGPAKKAGLKSGDIITKVDGEDYTKKNTEELANYIKGSSNKEVKLTIIRDGEEKEITIERDEVEVPTVTSKTYEVDGKKIGYIDISIFSNYTDKQFKSKLKKLEKENIDGLVIDVRDNIGGYLSSVTNICNLFLEKNKVIYKLEKDDEIVKVVKDDTKEKRTYPVTVLINHGSASASEILASAIKESYKNGKVVGINSYGKGTVQQTKELSDGSMLKYTVENWLTPNGKWINEKGVEPTDKVELSDEYYNNPTEENDNQLQTALNNMFK